MSEIDNSGLIVVDASAIVAALVDTGPAGKWAETLLRSKLAAPPLVYPDVAQVLQRASAQEEISADVAALAHGDLLDLRIDLIGYAPLADRIWELGPTLSGYEAWYVASAELLEAPLATLDRRLSQAPGTRCEFLLPPHPND